MSTIYVDSIGKRRKDDYAQDTTYFHKLQEKYWEDLLDERVKEMEAKNKFREVDREAITKYLEKFPKFKPHELEDLKLQFQAFDLNQDGLIDFNELTQVLDDLGDTSSLAKREQYFIEIDEDGSGAIDFEEYVGLIYTLHYGEERTEHQTDNIRFFATFGNEKVSAMRDLTLSEKMKNGLF